MKNKTIRSFVYLIQIAVSVFLYFFLSGHMISTLSEGYCVNPLEQVGRYVLITFMILVVILLCFYQIRKGGRRMALPFAFLVLGAVCYNHNLKTVDEMTLYSVAYITMGVINILLGNLSFDRIDPGTIKIKEA